MTTGHTFLLGAIAGVTIFLGLPLARARRIGVRPRIAMTGLATGILVFLLWDVLSNGVEPVESALEAHRWATFAPRAGLLAGGFALGLLSLVYYETWMSRRRSTRLVGPGAAALDEFADGLSPARHLSLLIATGIGLHNFGEGLAIGQSAANGAVSLAVVLIIGFGLHNSTEGFGVVGPLAADAEAPSWSFIFLLGLIGGGPTFLGTVVGYEWVSVSLQIFFFAIAAGSILFVVIELFAICRRPNLPVLVAWSVLAGVALGFATDFVLTASGV